MRKIIILALLLGACSSAPAADFAGNVYPIECRGDLSYVPAPVVELSPVQMERIAAARKLEAGKRLFGLYGNGIIIIDASLRGWKRDDVIRHERCHAIAGAWHK